MGDFLTQYGLFLAKTATVLLALLLLIGRSAALAMRTRGQGHDRLTTRKLNKKFRSMALAMQREVLPAAVWKKLHKHEQAALKADKTDRKRVFVLDFHGDLRATQVASLREEVTAVLTVARPEDEVIVRLESPGGVVHGYGLASSQLARLRDKGIPLTIAVDKVAASGGYMMACVANRIVAAPFAIVGSIGVVAQVPNVHRLLKKHDVDFELYTAGEWKRTLTMFGENTDAGRAKFKEELEEAHLLFKDFIRTHRGQMDIERVATGEHWYGVRALELGLIDAVGTSDDLLLAASETADVLEVHFKPQQAWSSKVALFASAAIDGLVLRMARRDAEPKL
jgi:serine protease SohB